MVRVDAGIGPYCPACKFVIGESRPGHTSLAGAVSDVALQFKSSPMEVSYLLRSMQDMSESLLNWVESFKT